VKPFLLLFLLFPVITFSQHFGRITLEVKDLPATPAKDVAIETYVNSFPESKALTADQKSWFYWTNYSRSNPQRFWDSVVLPLIKVYPQFQNSYSASLKRDLYNAKPLPLLKPNRTLAAIAQQHASALADVKSDPSHTSPDGQSFQQRMQKAGLRCVGENISFGPSNGVLGLVLLYLDQGVPDLGHRTSLLNPSYTEMGIGISSYPNKMYMIIQDFGCSPRP
jgi:hypothetical protein